MITRIYIFACILITVLNYSSVLSQKSEGEDCYMNDGKYGVCRSIHLCFSTMRYVRKKTKPFVCSIRGNTPIICCEKNNVPTQKTVRPDYGFRNSPASTENTRKSALKCEEYSKPVVSILETLPLYEGAKPIKIKIPNCHYESSPLIIGGEEAMIGEYPHMAAVGWIGSEGSDYKWKCGGTLISENYVLTAAHCTYITSNDILDPKPSVVRLGAHNLNSFENSIDVGIKTIKKHPERLKIRESTKYHDIALLELDKYVSFNRFIRPACLWSNPIINKTLAVATGWGLKESFGPSSDTLQKVSLNVLNQELCSNLFANYRNRKLAMGIIDEQFCAGHLKGGRDTCHGDSGGPLQINFNTNRCIFYVVGITSFGNSCGLSNSPGVYTKVAKYIDWIEEEVWGADFL